MTHVCAPKLLSDSSFSLLHISNTTELVEVAIPYLNPQELKGQDVELQSFVDSVNKKVEEAKRD